MAIETSVNIDVNVEGTATVKQAAQGFEDLGDAVAKTQREAEALALQYGLTDQRTQDAIKRAGIYKTQLEALDYAIDNAKVSSEALFRATQALIGGFQAVVGSVAIFAGESEDLQRILLKVQASMAIAQGIKDWNEFSGALRQLASVIGERLVLAFSTLRAAIASTGIGLAVIAIGSLITKFISLREETKKTAEEQKKYNDELFKLRKEREILQKGDEQYTRDELKNVSDRLAAGQKELQEKRDARTKYVNDLRILGVEEADSDRKRAEANLKEIALNNERLVNERLKLQKKIEEYDKQAAAKAKAERDLNYKSQSDDLKKSLDEKKRLEDEAFEQWIAQEVENDDYRQYLLQKRLAQEEEDFQNWIAQEIENEEYRTRKKQEEADKRKQIEQDLFNASQDLFNASQDLVRAIDEFNKNANAKIDKDFENRIEKLKELGYSEEQISKMRDSELQKIDERSRQAFEMEKKLRYAQTLLSTIEGATNAFTTAQKSPITAAVPAYPFLQAAAAAAFGLAQLQQISRSSYESKFTPLTKTGNPNIPSANIRTSSLPQSENILATNRKVYVLEGDITRTQQRVASNQSVSVLGG